MGQRALRVIREEEGFGKGFQAQIEAARLYKEAIKKSSESNRKARLALKTEGKRVFGARIVRIRSQSEAVNTFRRGPLSLWSQLRDFAANQTD